MVDNQKFGSTTMGLGIGSGLENTNDTTAAAQTIDVLGSGSENVYNSFVAPHNRNLSINQSTFYDSTGNIQSNVRKLDPLNQTISSEIKRGSSNNEKVKMVASLLKKEKS